MKPVEHSEPSHGAESPERRLLVLVAAALIVELLYVFVISAGKMIHWPFYLSYLNDLAEGLRQRHLHLGIEPDPALLAQPNPFDPNNRALWYWDVSLYQRHYYLYWGPLPALLLAVVKTVFRISSVVMDDEVVFWLTTLQLVAGTLFIERAGRRFYAQPSGRSRPPLTLEVLAVFVLGLANPTLYNLARPGVYEAAIVGGQAFILLGLVFAYDGISDAAPRCARLLAAGACWSCALACRVSLAPAVALLVVVTALFWTAGQPQRRWPTAVGLVWLGLPVAVGLVGLLTYNRLVSTSGWSSGGSISSPSSNRPSASVSSVRTFTPTYAGHPSSRVGFHFSLRSRTSARRHSPPAMSCHRGTSSTSR